MVLTVQKTARKAGGTMRIRNKIVAVKMDRVPREVAFRRSITSARCVERRLE